MRMTALSAGAMSLCLAAAVPADEGHSPRARPAREGGVPGHVQSRRAGVLRARRGPAPLLPVRGRGEGLRRSRRRRPLLRHGLVGDGDEPLPSRLGRGEPVGRADGPRPEEGRGGGREGQGGGDRGPSASRAISPPSLPSTRDADTLDHRTAGPGFREGHGRAGGESTRRTRKPPSSTPCRCWGTAFPGDKTYATEKKAAAILNADPAPGPRSTPAWRTT
jgi:hypothetical protein